MNDTKTTTFYKPIQDAHSILVPGFESTLKSFTVVFETENNLQVRHPVSDTAMGYFNDDIGDYKKVWFEYEKSPGDYEITLHLI